MAAVTAARGRGKSALAGQLILVLRVVRLSLRPQKRQRMYGTICGRAVSLYCAGCLVSQREQADWLVVDEAAAIPAPLLLNWYRVFLERC